MGQFKNLERRDANQPDDLITVRLLESGLYGDKEAGDTIDLPARTASRLIQAKLASTQDEDAADPLEVRIDHYLSQHDAALVSDPETSGQAGLAALDRIAGQDRALSGGEQVNGRMFRDSQDLAEQRMARGVYDEAEDRTEKVVQAQNEAVEERREEARALGVTPAEDRTSQDSTYTDKPKSDQSGSANKPASGQQNS